MQTSSSPLPWITPDLPGIGGFIKSAPEDFVVEELPLYEPCGSGEHVYVCVRRSGWTTRELADRLARIAGVDPRGVGFAGLKDKEACVSQTFSLAMRPGQEDGLAARVEAALAVEVSSVRRHANKLRVGHLLGNRFRLVVAGVGPDPLPRAREIAAAVRSRGLPNFFGAQRMGAGHKNVQRGRRLLDGSAAERAHASSWAGRLLLSAYQASLFNAWLVERMRRGWFAVVLRGDIVKRANSGALFEAEDPAVESSRLSQGEITYTGPMYGPRMRWASGAPGELEHDVLRAAGLDEAALANARLPGTRRAARLRIGDLEIDAHPRGLELRFTLPKGAYATMLAREFTKSDERTANEVVDDD